MKRGGQTAKKTGVRHLRGALSQHAAAFLPGIVVDEQLRDKPAAIEQKSQQQREKNQQYEFLSGIGRSSPFVE